MEPGGETVILDPSSLDTVFDPSLLDTLILVFGDGKSSDQFLTMLILSLRPYDGEPEKRILDR